MIYISNDYLTIYLSSCITHIIQSQLKPEKLKGMSKKQLRNIRKTIVNKNGQVELVTPWSNNK